MVTQYWPVVLMMFIMLPVVLYDVNRFSNRFAGPIYRVRKELEKFEETGQIPKIKFREKDYWQDLAVQMNIVSEHMRQLENEVESLKNKSDEYACN